MTPKTISASFAALLLLIVPLTVLTSCGPKENANHDLLANNDEKIGLLLVNHGSRSETWRNALLELEKNVTDSIMKAGLIKGIKTAFMEYTEPSIATRMKEFDAEGYSDVVIVPVFLTVSPHTFEDIPTILGQKEDPQSLELLKIENIERYTPTARVHLTPTLDFTSVLKTNVLRRVSALSENPEKEGLVLIGYGDEAYEKEWGDLFDNVGAYVKENKGISAHSYGWCGHIAHYDPNYTTIAINKVLEQKEKAIVIPVLVAHDEMFQVKIIGDGIAKVDKSSSRVAYRPDAILPDPEVEKWVINISLQFASKLKQDTFASR
ncbi:MAG TPA: CbiX/SirB N-terminal domain-containing protein [Cyclobacteriaceae bacterium]|nr:CbiX/SirB N-terminal domain-containing protein [Cyclobacteriaceae bacterium]